MAKHGVFDATRVQLPYWYFLSGAYYEAPANQAITLPSEATIVQIETATSPCYFEINNPIVTVFSSGYVPANSGRIIGPLSNLNTLRIHAPGATVHIMFFKEV